jgi:hypothetical protein
MIMVMVMVKIMILVSTRAVMILLDVGGEDVRETCLGTCT